MVQQPVIYTKPHSRLGIASLLTAILTFLIVTFLTIMAMIFGSKRSSLNEPLSTVWGILFFIVAPIAHGVGLILGIIALFQKGRKKVTAVFGILLNAGFVALGFLFVILLLSAVAGFR